MSERSDKRHERYDRDMALVRDLLRGGQAGRENVRGTALEIGVTFDVRQPDGSWFRYDATPRDIGRPKS